MFNFCRRENVLTANSLKGPQINLVKTKGSVNSGVNSVNSAMRIGNSIGVLVCGFTCRRVSSNFTADS